MKKYTEIELITEDNIKIAGNYYSQNLKSIVIIAPGWCMTKDSKVFKNISEEFAKNYDVICIDFRGHGKSSGTFTFTAKEELDLASAVNFAKIKNFKYIYLVGFSLGSATALIYASLNKNINGIIAISAPTEFIKIENKMWKKEAWLETIKKFELSRFLSIRPCIIPQKKIKPIDIIDKIKIPTLFIAGEKDPTVCAWHTETLYSKAICDKKYKLYPNGYHAEDIFLYHKEDFLKTCNDWLNSINKSN